MLSNLKNILTERFMLFIGVACILAGATALSGWYTHNTHLFHLFIGDVPIRYNSALCYLSLGIALVALDRSYQITSYVAGCFVTLIGGLTVLQYIFNVNLGIDEMFFKSYYSINTSSSGRMSPHAATSYFSSGLAILFLSKKPISLERAQLAIIVGIIPLVVGALSLIGHLISMQPVYAWLHVSHNSIPTAAMFIIVNLTLICFTFKNKPDRKLKNATPQFVMVFVATLSIFLWRDFYQAGLKQLQQITQNQTDQISNYIKVKLNEPIFDLKAIDRTLTETPMAEEDWIKSAKLFLNSETHVLSVMWMDPTRQKIWAPATPYRETLRTLIQSEKPEIVRTFNEAVKNKAVSLSNIVSFGDNVQAMLYCMPLYKDGQLSGFAVEIVDVNYILNDLNTGSLGAGYFVTIKQNNQKQPIFNFPQNPDMLYPQIESTNHLTFQNLNWTISVRPYFTLANQQTSVAVSYFILIMGLLLSFVLYSYMKMYILNKHLRAEIEERKQLELKNASLNDQLVTAARYAGMADIAASMLHNIGNALNSVRVSVGVLHEKLNQSRMSSLMDIVKMMQEHQQDLGQFIESDPKGKLIPEYLTKLAQIWEEDCDVISKEIFSLNHNIEIIHTIVTNQSTLTTTFEISQEVVVSDLVNEALTLNRYLFQNDYVQIVRDYSPIEPATLDKVKLLQVLTNLIKNGIEAMQGTPADHMKLTVRIKPLSEAHFIIQVKDIGHGILPENKGKIFTQGFTTKTNGHGIGLHASAIAIGEMGGKCTFDSEGEGQGATFSIILPYQPDMKYQEAVA
jgi:signal transduction histidine kinase